MSEVLTVPAGLDEETAWDITGWTKVGNTWPDGVPDDVANGAYVLCADHQRAGWVHDVALGVTVRWPRPVLIEHRISGQGDRADNIWQITAIGRDAPLIATFMDGLVTDWSAPSVPRPVSSPFKITHRHLKVHRVAVRQGGWACVYCGVMLVDVCADDDMIVDWNGKRMVNPESGKSLPTFDHLVPQSMLGSNAVENLVLACQTCNSRKGAM